MSLLLSGRETVTVYPETLGTDDDGNIITRPSPTGLVLRAAVQPLSSTETSERGFTGRQAYRIRLQASAPILGAQAVVEWRGHRWSVEGDAVFYNGSPRTAHVDYVIVRS